MRLLSKTDVSALAVKLVKVSCTLVLSFSDSGVILELLLVVLPSGGVTECSFIGGFAAFRANLVGNTAEKFRLVGVIGVKSFEREGRSAKSAGEEDGVDDGGDAWPVNWFLAGKVREYSVIGESVLFWRIGSKNITEVFRLVSVIGAKL